MAEDIKLTDVQFAAILLKDKDGTIKVVPFPDTEEIPAPESVDEVYNACNTVCRNIDQQQQAVTIQRAMMQVAQAVNGQTESGLVVPGGKK